MRRVFRQGEYGGGGEVYTDEEGLDNAVNFSILDMRGPFSWQENVENVFWYSIGRNLNNFYIKF